ncbi:MAG: hypothetical protein AB7E26_13485 [Chryseobacterium sp.]
MNETNIFALITALGAPILVFIGGLVSWLLKNRKEELKAIEERALEKRIETYNKILNPFIVLFAAKDDQKIKDKALNEIISIEYRKAAFNLITFGSDEMVNSYNNMMQGFYKNESNINPNETMRKFANFLLSIRKDVYNKETRLKEWDMLKFMINDIDEMIKNY